MPGAGSGLKAPTLRRRVGRVCPLGPRDPAVLAIIAQLEETLGERASLAMLAGRVGLSESRLSHLFKQDTGLSFRQYRKRARLARAADLLESTDLSVKEIAAKVGSDAGRLARDFKAERGVPPREYRALLRGGAYPDRASLPLKPRRA